MTEKAKVTNVSYSRSKPDSRLACVITLQEAVILTGKSRTAIHFQIQRGNITARRSITGGDWLLSFDDVSKLYKIKRSDLLWTIG